MTRPPPTWVSVGVLALVLVVTVGFPDSIAAGPVPPDAGLAQFAASPRWCVKEIQRLRKRVAVLEGRLRRRGCTTGVTPRSDVTAMRPATAPGYMRLLQVSLGEAANTNFLPSELRAVVRKRKYGAPWPVQSRSRPEVPLELVTAARALRETLAKSGATRMCLDTYYGGGEDPCRAGRYLECTDNREGFKKVILGCKLKTSIPDDVFAASAFSTVTDVEFLGIANFPESITQLEALRRIGVRRSQLTHLPEFIGRLKTLQIISVAAAGLTHLPESLGQLKALEYLDVSNNELTVLPESFGQLKKLRYLDIHYNKLTHLPESFGQLEQLQNTRIDGNKLKDLPESFGQLNQLRKARLDGNKLKGLPESMGQLKALQRLQLGHNEISHLPESIGQLKALQSLNIINNKLARLPESIGQIKSMRSCNFNDNELTHLPESIGQLIQLRMLKLRHNKLTHLPESLVQLQKLRRLIIDGNKLMGLPESMGQLKGLQRLQLGHNEISHLPESIGELMKLQELYVQSNKLTHLPESLGHLKELAWLGLYKNKLATLPESFGNLTVITELDLSVNRLSQLPDSIVQLTALKKLDLRENRLTHLPESMGQMIALEEFGLKGNMLTYLPESIGQLVNLETLQVSKNRLTHLPVSISSLSSLRMLAASNNMLTTLPDAIGGINRSSKLELMLFFNGNRLTRLPESITKLRGLTVLQVSMNRLTHLPESIGDALSLEWLMADHNLLTTLPASLGEAPKLSKLSLASNQLTHLPESLEKLPKCKELLLGTNLLTRLPAKMPRVDGKLDISENMLTSLNGLTTVRYIVAHHNYITEIPAEVATMKSLETLDLRFNSIASIPEFHGTPYLHELQLQHNKITELPEGALDGAPLLSSLYLSHNKLKYIAGGAFEKAPSLNNILLSNNVLEMLPLSLVNLDSIHVLDVSNNRLREVSQSMWEWMLSKGSMDRNLANNNIAATWTPKTVPRIQGGALYLDKVTIGAGDIAATVGQMIGIANATQMTWTRNSVLTTSGRHGQECFFEQPVGNGRAQKLYVRVCLCRSGFYAPGGGQGCRTCPRHAICEDEVVKCAEGYHLWYDKSREAQCVKCLEGVECHDNRILPRSGQWWDLDYAIGDSVNETNINLTAAPRLASAMYQQEGGPPPGSKIVYSCHNPDACEGGEDAWCAEGYEGRLCATCSDGYFSSGHGVCEHCPDIRITIAYSVLGFLTASVLTASVFLRADKKLDGLTGQLRRVNMSRMAAVGEVLTIVKILVSFLQIVVALDVVFDVEWPRMLRISDEIFGWVNLDWIKSSAMECLWEHGSATSDIRDAASALLSFSYYARLCMSSALPLMISGGLFLIFAVAQGAVRWGGVNQAGGFARTLNTLSTRCLQSHLLVWTFVYLPVSSKALGFFLCDSFDGGQTHWLHDDLSIQCYTPVYYQFMPVSIVTLLVYTLGLPVFVIVTFLMRQSSRFCGHHHGSDGKGGTVLVQAGLMDAFMVLSRPYRDQFGYWDSVEMVRKVLVGAAATLLGSTPTFQLTTALLISFFAAILHFYCWPFKAAQANRLAGTNLILVYLTMSLGLLRKLDVSEGKRAIFGGMVLGLDLVFCCLLLGIILWDMLHSARGRVDVIARRMVLYTGKLSK